MAKYGKMKQRKKSWVWVVFWSVLFWPVGLYLLFRKMHSDKSIILKSVSKVSAISFVLLFMGLFNLLIALTARDIGERLSFFEYGAIALGAGGIWLLFISRKMKMDGERYKKYIALIVNQNQTAIDNIALALGISYEAAVKDLRKMIVAGYFTSAHIDENKREIILASSNTSQQASLMSAATTAQVTVKLTACVSCGANNRVTVGDIVECEYCGTLLQANSEIQSA